LKKWATSKKRSSAFLKASCGSQIGGKNGQEATKNKNRQKQKKVITSSGRQIFFPIPHSQNPAYAIVYYE
jgi:hypothetical protein